MVARLLRSFGFALRGVVQLLRTQANARWHLAASMLVLAAGVWIELSGLQWALLALAMGLVWSAEAFNSALEALADALHPARHPLIGRAKDLAAAGVLLAALAAVGVAVGVFFG